MDKIYRKYIGRYPVWYMVWSIKKFFFMGKTLKLFKPYVSWRAIFNVVRVLLSDQLAEGKWVKQFEYEFSKKFNLRNVVAVNSGTSALELAYELADIRENDEVITTVLTCTATNIPLKRRKAKIIFADIDADLNINVDDVKRKITERTKAIVFVHFGGNNRGLDEILDIGRQKGITIIEDAAQAVGSDNWGKADFSCVSLQAIKTLTSGDGGFLICKKQEDYEKARRLRWFGYDREKKQKEGDTDLIEAGYKYHMNNIAAAIGLGNLKNIDKIIAHRKMIGEIYKSYGLFAHIWLAGGFLKRGDVISLKYSSIDFRQHWGGFSFETGQHHYRNDKYTLFGKTSKAVMDHLQVVGGGPYPKMDKVYDKYFFVPLHHKVTKRQAHKIGKFLQQYENTSKNQA